MQMFRNIDFSASYILFKLFKMSQKSLPIQYKNKSVVSTINYSPNWRTKLPIMAVLGFLWSKPKENFEEKDRDISIIIKKADKEYDNGHYEDCYHILLKSECEDSVEVKWRMCRALYNLAKETKYDHKYRKELITEAYEIISNVLPQSQDNYAVHKWYALVLEAKSSNDGYKEKIKQLEKIKEELDLAVALNPNDATTLHMLGEWCYQLTAMPWHHRKTAELLFSPLPNSCYEDALEYFLRAESVQPRFYSLNLLRIGSCYLKLKKEDQAKYYLHLAASYPAKSNEDHQANREATDLLKKLVNFYEVHVLILVDLGDSDGSYTNIYVVMFLNLSFASGKIKSKILL